MEDNLPYEAQTVESLIARADQAIAIQNKLPVETLLKEKLKILRENHNFTQEQLARYLSLEIKKELTYNSPIKLLKS